MAETWVGQVQDFPADLPPPAPLVPCVHTKCPQALLWRQHCRSTFLASTESTVKSQDAIQKATDVGAVGQKTMQNRLLMLAEPIRTRQGTSARIATNSVGFPYPYIANIPWGQGVGHPPVEVDYPLLLPHAVLYRFITKRGIDVKHANCVEARVDHKFGEK